MLLENSQTTKMELSVGNSQRLKSFGKKNFLRCLTRLQVRKIDDDADNKKKSKLI